MHPTAQCTVPVSLHLGLSICISHCSIYLATCLSPYLYNSVFLTVSMSLCPCMCVYMYILYVYIQYMLLYNIYMSTYDYTSLYSTVYHICIRRSTSLYSTVYHICLRTSIPLCLCTSYVSMSVFLGGCLSLFLGFCDI